MSLSGVDLAATGNGRLREVFATAMAEGWALWDTSLTHVIDLLAQASELQILFDSGSNSAIRELRPTMPQSARRRSLSAKHGTGKFPLHTDCAHWKHPPDLVLLELLAGEAVAPTTLLQIANAPGAYSNEDLTHGVFTVSGGMAPFQTSVLEAGAVRFDSGCMQAGDDRARRAEDWVTRHEVDAQIHVWRKNQVLVINNRATLHGRANSDASLDRVLGRVWVRTRT